VSIERFEFAFAPAYRRAGALFGVRPGNSWVEVDDTELRARYGPWRLATPLSNIKHVEVTGPYLFVKTAGPARLGITDIGLSFTPNGARGVLVQFKEKVQGTGPFRLLKHPEVTLGVEKPETLAALLDQR